MGANDEMISFKDEGEQEEKISENVSAERDLDDVKSSLVNESENNSSSSDSEVKISCLKKIYSPHTRLSIMRNVFLMVLKVSIVSLPPSVCIFSPCQQAERRPQTRPDSESYEKTRDYFSEGKKKERERENILGTLCAQACIYVAFLPFLKLTLTNDFSLSLQH